MADLDGADEGDFLELLIANERILDWVDELQDPGNPERKKEIIMELDKLVDSKDTYAEEARRAGALPVLTRILCNTKDEEVMDAISRIMVVCSGPMASGGKVKDYTYGDVTVRIREGALGDGLGAKVWTVAHILCRELVAYPAFLAGHEVLEIGAGCGVCGVLAAKMGTTQVVLTDVEGPVLRNLRDCVLLNSAVPPQQQAQAAQDTPAAEPSTTGQQAPWEAENMHVRKLDWLESLELLSKQHNSLAAVESGVQGSEHPVQGSPTYDPETFYAKDYLRQAEDPADPGDLPPTVPLQQTYNRIIGTDIMYEPMHAQLVAAVLAHRLAPGGAALMCCAVRQARTFATFTAECARRGLRYRKRQVQPVTEYGGILGRDEDYEGGFLLMAVDHQASPCEDWHRADFDTAA